MVPDNNDNEYLLSLRAVRERCFQVQELGAKNKLAHFDIDTSKLQDIVQLVISLIKRDYDEPSAIPSHGRWRHFDAGGRPRLQNLIQQWENDGIDSLEQTRRVLDLLVIAVILDIDPSQGYVYHEQSSNRYYKRKEGVAIALLDMFMAGVFSMNPEMPHRVDCKKKNSLLSRQNCDILSRLYM